MYLMIYHSNDYDYLTFFCEAGLGKETVTGATWEENIESAIGFEDVDQLNYLYTWLISTVRDPRNFDIVWIDGKNKTKKGK